MGKSLLVLTFVVALGSSLARAQQTGACSNCDQGDSRVKAIAEEFAADIHAQIAMSCNVCHAGGGRGTEANRISAIPRERIPELCGSCHADADRIKKFNPSLHTDQLAQYRTSVHGIKFANGDTKAAVCTDCHGVHRMRPASDPGSSVHPLNVAATCQRCHSDAEYMKPYHVATDQYAGYSDSVHHEAMVAGGDLSAPTCTTCHGSHGAVPPGVKSVASVCGTCHVLQARYFEESPHKHIFAMMNIASCVTCHSSHRIKHPDAVAGHRGCERRGRNRGQSAPGGRSRLKGTRPPQKISADPVDRNCGTPGLPGRLPSRNRTRAADYNGSEAMKPQVHRLAIMLLLMLSGAALATTHPFLDSKADDAKCLECHAAKAKGKAVHSAIAIGCSVCHEVRVNNDLVRIKLVTPSVGKLCLECHADKDASQIKAHVHSPAVRDCLKCHDAHSSDHKNQLRKSPSGEAKENLCLTCHTTGLKVPPTGSRHAALDLGCDSCHVSHKTGENLDGVFHLTKGSPALCLDCHDAKDAELAKAHRSQPFGKSDCLSCHDPHQSSSPWLLQKFVHMPFAKQQCDSCHAPASNGRVVLTKAAVTDLCVTCHSEEARKIQVAKVQHPGATGDCTDCHSPHAGTSRGFLKPDAVNVCLVCHSH